MLAVGKIGSAIGRIGATAPSKGVPESITVDGITYTRIRFGGQPLDTHISSQPLYGRAA